MRGLAFVTFLPAGTMVPIAVGESLFTIGRRAGVPIPTACEGKATCGLCRVKVISGEDQLSALNSDEERHLGNTYFISKLRLSCQARARGGDVVVQLPDGRRR